jgi:hypothetical protein
VGARPEGRPDRADCLGIQRRGQEVLRVAWVHDELPAHVPYLRDRDWFGSATRAHRLPNVLKKRPRSPTIAIRCLPGVDGAAGDRRREARADSEAESELHRDGFSDTMGTLECTAAVSDAKVPRYKYELGNHAHQRARDASALVVPPKSASTRSHV